MKRKNSPASPPRLTVGVTAHRHRISAPIVVNMHPNLKSMHDPVSPQLSILRCASVLSAFAISVNLSQTGGVISDYTVRLVAKGRTRGYGGLETSCGITTNHTRHGD